MTPEDEQLEEALNPVRHYPNKSLVAFTGTSVMTMCGKEVSMALHSLRWRSYPYLDDACPQCIEACSPPSSVESFTLDIV